MEINTGARVFGYDTELTFYDVDCRKRLKLSSMLKMFAILAGADFADRGLGHIFLRDHGYAFLVSRGTYKFFRHPLLEEKVHISTWFQGTSGAKFIRCYEMKTLSGEPLIIGESVWVCVNTQTKKIMPPKEFPWNCEPSPRDDIPIHCKRIGAKNAAHIRDYLIPYSNIDYNGHLNNTVYADIICDTLSHSELRLPVSEFYLNYINESHIGETLSLSRAENDGSSAVIIGTVGDKKCFESEIVFSR